MPLLTLLDAQLAYGDLPQPDRAAFFLESGERIGLIGRNGTGKSSRLTEFLHRFGLDEALPAAAASGGEAKGKAATS
jgi:ATP-binding cassette subfamily F protein uup